MQNDNTLDSLWQTFKTNFKHDLYPEDENILKSIFYYGAVSALFLISNVGIEVVRKEGTDFLEESKEKDKI